MSPQLQNNDQQPSSSFVNFIATPIKAHRRHRRPVKRILYQDEEVFATTCVEGASMSSADDVTLRNPSANVRSTCEFLNDAMGSTQIHLDLNVNIDELLANHNLKKVAARADGYCLIHAWSTSTNTSEETIKHLLVQEFNNNLLQYMAAGISRSEFYSYVEHGTYTFDAADAIIDMLCNATGRSALILGKKYTFLAHGQSTVVHGVTEINRIGSPVDASSCVLLLKTGERYDGLI
jgi:hypothetical protein